jgi:hypothetical protein
MARDQNALRIIASSHVWNTVDFTARVRGQQDIDDNRGWLADSRRLFNHLVGAGEKFREECPRSIVGASPALSPRSWTPVFELS